METTLLILSVTFISLVAFETMAVATAMPFIADILHGKSLYALAAGVTLATQLMTTALAGPWCDAKGPKPCFFTGAALASAGLTIATFAPTMEWVVAGRAIQGLGSGLLIVPLYVLIGNYVAPERQPRFFGAFAAAWVLPSLVGPLFAGFLVEHASWRWVFGITPLLFAILVPVAFVVMKRIALEDKHFELHVGTTVWFAMATGLGIALLQVVSANQTGYDWHSYALMALGMCVAIIFAIRILPDGTFVAKPGVPAIVLLRGLMNGTLLAVETYLPLMLKEVHGWTATEAGMILTSSSVFWAIGSWIQGRITAPHHRRRIPTIALIAQASGTLLTLSAVSPHISGLFVIIGWAVAGLGLGLAYPALTVKALSVTKPERHGEVSAALQLADTIGASLLIAVAGILYAFSLGLGNVAFAVPIITMTVLAFLGLFLPSRLDEQR